MPSIVKYIVVHYAVAKTGPRGGLGLGFLAGFVRTRRLIAVKYTTLTD
jgi:hypothetical protein